MKKDDAAYADNLLYLRNRLEEEIEEQDRKIVSAVADRVGRNKAIGSAVPGTEYYYLIQGVVMLKEAHESVQRQLSITFHRQRHADMPYGVTLERKS